MFGMLLPLFRRFPCFLVPSPNSKRLFSFFKVSLNMMCQSDSTSADVEIRKPPREHHLSGAPDCLIEKPAVWSFFLRSIVHSSLIIRILLFDRILGLPFALQAECSRSTSSIPTSVRAIKVADGSQFVWFLSGQRPYIFHRCLLLFFVFVSWLSEPRQICRTAHGVLCCVNGTPDPTPTISGLYPTVNRAFISHHSYCAV